MRDLASSDRSLGYGEAHFRSHAGYSAPALPAVPHFLTVVMPAGHANNMISPACVIDQATGCDIIEGKQWASFMIEYLLVPRCGALPRSKVEASQRNRYMIVMFKSGVSPLGGAEYRARLLLIIIDDSVQCHSPTSGKENPLERPY